MSAAANKTTDPRGLKRICLECGGRFYDLNKRPITCPSCDTEFTGEIKVKTRRGRSAVIIEETEGQVDKKTVKETGSDEDEDENEVDEAEIVSLEDLENEMYVNICGSNGNRSTCTLYHYKLALF